MVSRIVTCRIAPDCCEPTFNNVMNVSQIVIICTLATLHAADVGLLLIIQPVNEFQQQLLQ